MDAAAPAGHTHGRSPIFARTLRHTLHSWDTRARIILGCGCTHGQLQAQRTGSCSYYIHFLVCLEKALLTCRVGWWQCRQVYTTTATMWSWQTTAQRARWLNLTHECGKCDAFVTLSSNLLLLHRSESWAALWGPSQSEAWTKCPHKDRY